MKLKELCQDTYVYASNPKLNYLSEYARKDPSIRSAISEFPGVKTDLYSDLSKKAQDDLKVSLVLSDFTSVFPEAGKEPRLIIAAKENSYFPKNVTLSQDFIEKLSHKEGKPVVNTGYIYRTDEQAQEFIRQVELLVQSGRLMIRPTPIVLGLERELTPQGNRSWQAIPVEPNSPGDTWFAQDNSGEQNAIPLKEGEHTPQLEEKVTSFTLPYLEGVSFEQLSRILDDENDSLAEFRKGVREMLEGVRKEPAKSTDILNDLVRPATEKIERKFKSITNIHRLKVAGVTLGTAALGLTALTTAGVGAALAGVLGASGLGLITKEYADHLKEKAELKEMPFYLLWRLGRESRK